VSDFFYGQFLNVLKCQNCKHESISFNNFLDIQLSFEKASYYSADVESLLKEFLREEMISDSFVCPKEKKVRTCVKAM
jgi:ubiquitin C-terminal hydrolase